MAAVSAPHASSALTPPASSHDGQNSWSYSVPTENENGSQPKMNDYSRPSQPHPTNGNSLPHKNSRPDLSQRRTNTYGSGGSTDSGHLAPGRITALSRKDSNISETGSAPDSLLDLYGPNRSGISSMDSGERKGQVSEAYDVHDTERSRWIHRDKLARIESEELQAAGIVLPRNRAASRSRPRDNSRDQQGNGIRSEQAGQTRHMLEAPPVVEEPGEVMSWDLRSPEEVAADQKSYQDMSGGIKGVSKIPLLKTSPLPIPMEHLERDTPMQRKASALWNGEEEPISYSKTRGRSQSIKVLENTPTPTPSKRMVSEASPTKKNAPPIKGSASKSRATSAPQRPKTRNGSGNAQRPPTRSGEVKRPEGDPPWLATMYKPDPRLPPDQQLLPTVAKRLQQEQWEKEGKFGNAYDTSFRPLNDEEFRQPEISTQTIEMEEQKPEILNSNWPLQSPKSPTLSTGRPGTAGNYSTIPKITGTPQGIGPLPNSRPPIRTPEPPEDTKKGGCGCCVVM
ncbi:hypothetical protein LOCC1_G005146 [Lachnellula occidentalis]|uniref:TeaA receptor TeaR n=1 Tax=Lachnellula occidentalis TaxID=215460 RepID=A0A8H8RTC0_9HELO|nr:hypothetical protein LOCC1_G005146 [Lachnellula occidentalis]